MKRFRAITTGRFTLLRHRGANTVSEPGDATPASVERSALADTLQSILQGSLMTNGVIGALRGLIADERARIFQCHRDGETGQAVVRSITLLTDAVVSALFQRAEASCDPDLRRRSDGCALVALGGYGRREMNPASDVDLMFVYSRRADAYLDTILHPVLSMLWDVGFVVGHCCRSIDDCIRMARNDLTSCTSMLEARYLAGNPAIYEAFSAKWKRAVVSKQAAALVKRKLQEWDERHYRYGGSIYVQEPHIKEGPGVLRDVHAALCIARITRQVSAPS